MHVSSIKVDPYMNVDAGTMAPTEYVPLSIHILLPRLSSLTADRRISDMGRSLSSTTGERLISILETTNDTSISL